MKLRTIESAPKDGTFILLARKDSHAGKNYPSQYKIGRWIGEPYKHWTDLFKATHWCPLPTPEDEAESPIQLSQAHTNALTKDLARKREEIESLTAELQAVKSERDSLRAALEWAFGQMEGDSGTGASYWEQFPEYVAGVKALNPTPEDSSVDGRAE